MPFWPYLNAYGVKKKIIYPALISDKNTSAKVSVNPQNFKFPQKNS